MKLLLKILIALTLLTTPSCERRNTSNGNVFMQETTVKEIDNNDRQDPADLLESVESSSINVRYENDGMRLLKEGYKLDTFPEWNDCIRVSSEGKGEGLLSPKGEMVYSPDDYIAILGYLSPGNHLLKLKKAGSHNNNLYGFGDFKGNILVPVIYEDVSLQQHLKHGYAIVKDNDKVGVYSFVDQKEIVPSKHDLILCTYDGYISTKEQEIYNGKFKIMYIFRLYDYDGNEVCRPVRTENGTPWPVLKPESSNI